MAEVIRLEYSADEAVASANKANKAIEGNERTATRAGAAISKSFNESSTSVQRLMENAERKMKLAGAGVTDLVNRTYALKAAWAAAGTVAAGAFSAGAAAALEFAKANLTAENSISRAHIAYRLLRLAMSAGGGAAAFASTATGIVSFIAAEKMMKVALDQAEKIQKLSLSAAASGRGFNSEFALKRAEEVTGRDLGVIAGKTSAEVEQLVEKIKGIPDPVLRAARAYDTFGASAGQALGVLDSKTVDALRRSEELSLRFGGPLRSSLQQFKDFADNLNPFDGFVNSWKDAADRLKIAIASDVAGFGELLRFIASKAPKRENGDFGQQKTKFGLNGLFNDKIPSDFEFMMDAESMARARQGELVPGAPNRGGLGLGQAFQSGKAGTEDSIQAALKTAQASRQRLQGLLSRPGIQDDDFKSIDARLALVAKEEEALTAQLKLKEDILQADRRAAEFLKSAQLGELAGLDKIEEKRRQMLAESGKTPKARADIEKGAAVEQAKYLSDFDKKRQEAIDKTQSSMSNGIREAGARQLEEQSRNSAEIAKLQEVTVRTNEAIALAGIDARKASEFRLIQETSGKSVAQRLDAEDKIAAIERDYALQTFKLKAGYIDSEAKLRAALATTTDAKEAILQEAVARQALLNQQTQATIDAAQETAAVRKMQLVRGEQEKLFEKVRSAADGVFDALVTRTRSFGDLFKNLVLQPFLTLLKSISSSAIATLLTGGTGGSQGGGLIAKLGLNNLLGGFGRAGAPGGTTGFAGPVTAIPGLAGISWGQNASGQIVPLAGQMAGAGARFGGLGGAIGGGMGPVGLGGLSGLALGGASLGLFGAFKAGQSDNRLLKGLAPGIGAVSGLVGFGALASMFPALIAAGPAGWIAAAGIGATVGLIGAFKAKGENKLIENIKAVYGINVDRAFAKNPLMGIIKDQFGGDIDMGIRSPMVRELLAVYRMQSNQGSSGTGLGAMNSIARGVSLSGYGGNVYQNPVSINGASYGYGGALPSTGASDPFQTINNVVQTLAARPVAVQLMIDGRDVKASVMRTDKASQGRREGYAVASDPLLIFG